VLSGYYQYYVVDVIKPPVSVFNLFILPDAPSVSSAYQISVLLGSTLSSYPSGFLSDKYGRRITLFIAFILQLAAPLGLGLSVVPGFPKIPFPVDFLYGFIYGVGSTAFSVVA
jgi:MFS family permease